MSTTSLVRHAADAQFYRQTPNKSSQKKDCPSEMTPAYKTKEWDDGEKVKHYYTSARLVWNGVKYPLDYTHYDLEQIVNLIGLVKPKNAPNILAAKISFLVKVDDQKPKFFEFGLNCKNKDQRRYRLFSFYSMHKKYKDPKFTYKCIKHFYEEGRKNFESQDPCGPTPEYTVVNGDLLPGRHQHANHTEQLLVAYLARPEVAEELGLLLEQEISDLYAKFKTVKIYGMGIHFHSIRVCCGPCEYALNGLINDKEGIEINGERLGLFPNFVDQLPDKRFYTSRKFRIISTGTSNMSAGGHTTPKYNKPIKLGSEDDLSAYNINLYSKNEINKIYQTLLNNPIEAASDYASFGGLKKVTLFVSGKKATDEEKKAFKNAKAQE